MKCQSKNFIAQVKIYPQKFILEQKDDLSNKWLEYPYLRIFMICQHLLRIHHNMYNNAGI